MPNSRLPRVVGFQVPGASDDPAAPMVALLDVIPTPNWVAVFEREVAALTGGLGVASVTIEEDRVSFSGKMADRRRLADEVRALVERISRMRLDERFIEAAISPVDKTDDDIPRD